MFIWIISTDYIHPNVENILDAMDLIELGIVIEHRDWERV